MKKIFLIGAAALGMFFMTTSCMDNTEPAGIEEMRMAKSELLRAEALYKQALAATEQANAAIKQAEAEYDELVNQLKEIQVQEAQLDLEVRQAQQEYELALLEFDYQMQVASDSAEIMRLQADIAEYEWIILDKQLGMDTLSHKREQALEEHKAMMFDLQQKTAEAQETYENALAKIEAASYGLTEEEKGSLAIMIQNMKNARDALNKAENIVVDKQSALLAAQYALGRDTVYYQTYYQILVDAQYREVVKAQEVLTEAQAMDFTDVDKLTEEKETLEAENETLTREIADLRRQASDKAAAELDPLNNQLNVIQGQIDAIKHSIDELYVDLGYDYENGSVTTGPQDYPGAAAERHVFELEIPEAIVPDVAGDFNTAFGTANNSLEPNDPNKPNDNEVIIISGFEEVDGEWTLPGGIYSWEATYEKTKEILFNTADNTGLLKTIADKAIDPAQLSNYQLILSEQEAKKAEIDADYAFYLDVYNKGLAEFNTLAAEYGITYNSAWEFVADKDNLLAKATEAYQAYTAATPTAAQTEAFVVAVYNEQKARQALVGTAVAGWDKLTYANITATTPTATMQQVLDAYNNAQANPVENILTQENYAYTERITTESKLEDYCAAAKWNEASKELYGWHYLRAAITEDIIGYGDIFEINVDLTDWASPSYDVSYPGNLSTEFEERLHALAGTSYGIANFKTGSYYEQLGQSELVDKMSSIIANNASYTELAEALDALNEEIKTLQKTDADNQTEIYKKIRDLHAQKEAIEEQENEINIQISAKELEIAAIADYDGSNGYSDAPYSQAAAKQSQINSNNRTIGVINQAIEAIKFEINGNDVDANDSQFTLGSETYETIEEFYNAWVDQLKIDLADAQKTLSERQEDLECMLAANGDPMEEAVRIAERDLEQAQQDYDIALQQFNYWNEMMNQMLAALLGNEEVPENPEA